MVDTPVEVTDAGKALGSLEPGSQIPLNISQLPLGWGYLLKLSGF